MIQQINAALPSLADGTRKTTGVHGNAASVQSIAKVKPDGCIETARDGKPSHTERFEAVLPIPDEFHRRMLLNQDTKDILKSDTAAQRGTLQNIITTANVKISDTAQVSAFLEYFQSRTGI